VTRRVVVDTNVYVSHLIRPSSTPGRALLKAWSEDDTLISTATWEELREVLHRAKFARYIDTRLLTPYLNNVWSSARPVIIPSPIRACRDPKDDKFLEVAVHGHANLIITGDNDLLVLHPFRGIAILTPADYLTIA
jgi:uncharacterized protein